MTNYVCYVITLCKGVQRNLGVGPQIDNDRDGSLLKRLDNF